MHFSIGTYQAYLKSAPASVTEDDGHNGWGIGTLICILEETESRSEFYIIYPVGVSDPNHTTDDTSIVRLRYVVADGGIVDMIYYKQ